MDRDRLFSGSLYALSVTGVPWLGAITPIGGCALLAGWLYLAWAVFWTLGKMKEESNE